MNIFKMAMTVTKLPWHTVIIPHQMRIRFDVLPINLNDYFNCLKPFIGKMEQLINLIQNSQRIDGNQSKVNRTLRLTLK